MSKISSIFHSFEKNFKRKHSCKIIKLLATNKYQYKKCNFSPVKSLIYIYIYKYYYTNWKNIIVSLNSIYLLKFLFPFVIWNLWLKQNNNVFNNSFNPILQSLVFARTVEYITFCLALLKEFPFKSIGNPLLNITTNSILMALFLLQQESKVLWSHLG